jgi:hypothetical protein
VTNVVYDGCSPEEKKRWLDNMIMHHGELGVMLMKTKIENPLANLYLLAISAGPALSVAWSRDSRFNQAEA